MDFIKKISLTAMVVLPFTLGLPLMIRTFISFSFFQTERLKVSNSLLRCDSDFAVVEVNQDISVISHTHFLHITELAVSVTGFDPLFERMKARHEFLRSHRTQTYSA